MLALQSAETELKISFLSVVDSLKFVLTQPWSALVTHYLESVECNFLLVFILERV